MTTIVTVTNASGGNLEVPAYVDLGGTQLLTTNQSGTFTLTGSIQALINAGKLTVTTVTSDASRDIQTTEYLATASGTGYSSGDLILRSDFYDVSKLATPVLSSTIWYDLTTSTVISTPPSAANLTYLGGSASSMGTISDTAVINYTATASVIAALKGILGLQSLYLFNNSASTLSISGTHAETSALTAGIYAVWSNTPCFILVANSPVATSTTGYPIIMMSATLSNIIPVTIPASSKISAITAGTTGTLSYMQVA